METEPSAPPPVAEGEPSAGLMQTVSSILLSSQAPSAPPLEQSLAPLLPRLSPSFLAPIISAAAAAPSFSSPAPLLSFYNLCRRRLPALSSNPAAALPSILALLRPLLRFCKFADAQSLLLSFIPLDRPRLLHRHLLRPNHPTSKALLDTAVHSYSRLRQPHLAAQLFQSMKRRRLRPSLRTANILLDALVRSPSPASVPLAVFHDLVDLGVAPNTATFNILVHGYCSRT